MGQPARPAGAALLDSAAAAYSKHLVLPTGAADTLALWIAHLFCFKAFIITPRISFQAAEKGCGKTTALEITACLAPGPILTQNLTTAVLYRLLNHDQCTLLLDEVDAWMLGNEDMRSVLNAGHRRGGTVIRCDGPGLRAFNVFRPIALAGIGTLPETVQDRSIVIWLARKKPDEIRERFDPRRAFHLDQLRNELGRWCAAHFDELAALDPILPPGVDNRRADNWRPLFAIAALAGGNWPQRAIQAFQMCRQENDTPDQSIRVQLLNDIRAALMSSRCARIQSSRLAIILSHMEGRPWAHFSGRSPVSANQMAQLLRPFGIFPRTLRFNDTTAKGYLAADFLDAFERYLPRDPGPDHPSSRV